MTMRTWILICALLAPLMPTERARAITYEVPATTTQTYIGMVFGDAWAAYIRPAGCLWKKIGKGGLEEATGIKGTTLGERMYVVQSTTTVCNLSMSPLVTRGWELWLAGDGGDDIIVGGTKAPALFGNSGNDIIWGYGVSGVAGYFSGDIGDDIIIGSGTLIYLDGQGDDDELCVGAPAPYVAYMHGGPGSDTGCGDTSQGHQSIAVDPVCSVSDCAVF